MDPIVGKLTAWLLTFGHNFLTWLYNINVDLFQAALTTFCAAASAVVGLFPAANTLPGVASLPDSSDTLIAFIQTLNWFFPVTYFLVLVGIFSAAMLSYFVIAPLARWFKLLT